MELAYPQTKKNFPGPALVGIVFIILAFAIILGAIPTPGAAGILFGECVLEARTDCSGEDLSDADLSGLVLRNSILDYVSFENANLADALLSGSSLRSTYWIGAETAGANFDRVDLTGSNISQAQLDAAASCHRAVLPDGLACNK